MGEANVRLVRVQLDKADQTALRAILKRNGVFFPSGLTQLSLELDLTTGRGSVQLRPESQVDARLAGHTR